MKLLLDECLPVDLRHDIVGHAVFTVSFMRWKSVKNGRLLARAAAEAFEALITTDGSIEHQQNLASLPVAVVVLDATTNDLEDLRPFVPLLLETLKSLTPRAVTHITLP